MITEIFVSLDNLNFYKLDLNKEESINMRLTLKDTQDIAKVFSPYSLGFTFVATPNNLQALGHFGRTDYVGTSQKIRCKIYVNSILAHNGNLKLEKITYKNGKPEIITASFATTMTDLKTRFGNDTIRDLGSKLISWRPSDVATRLTSIANDSVDGVQLKYYVPFASTKRVWGEDVLTFEQNLPPTSDRLIKSDELRPAISFTTLLGLIKNKYNLQIISPIENRSEVRDLFVWCMGENFGSEGVFNTFILKSNLDQMVKFPPLPSLDFKYTYTSNLSNQSIRATRNETTPPPFGLTTYGNRIFVKILFNDFVFFGLEEQSITINLNRLGENAVFATQTTPLAIGINEYEVSFLDEEFIGNAIDFQISVNFTCPVSWSNSVLEVMNRGTYFFTQQTQTFEQKAFSIVNNNASEMNSYKIDIIKALPEIKVVDFLISYFKSFNLSALDVSPLNDFLYWYAPEDILSTKKEVTYTAENNIEKSIQEEFNYFIFKHADSEFRSNQDYKIGSGQNYGQTSFPEIKPDNAKEFAIETVFTIIPPIKANVMDSFYGFSEIGEPNYGELPIFYSHGSKSMPPVNVQSSFGNNFIASSISNYIQSLPFTTDNKSIAFSVLVYQNNAYRNNLFSRYYAEIISRYVNPRVLKHDFSLTLNANEVRDFRLENDIVIGENKYSVVDSTIDLTTGKTKLTLLNY